jgi:4'-phosphopantetheinyl transferase
MEFHAVKFTAQQISSFRQMLGSIIDAEKMKRIDTYRFQADRDRAIIGVVLSRSVLCKRLGLMNSELNINVSPSGKAYVRGARDFEFNIAHSGDWIVCGAGQGRIGVDVERIAEPDAGFAERYFSLPEAELLRTSDAASRRQLFFSIWTLKESYVKALGKGLTMPLDGFSLLFQSHSIRAVSEGRDAGFHFRLFQDLDPDFSFAMCSENPPPENARVWSLQDLIEDFLTSRL